jgi:Ubiquitin carboxyl-terminal hydrolases
MSLFFLNFDILTRAFQVDDCRRTHNYDEFICTFLTMLAHEGKLADLVQEHLAQPKKQGAAAKGRKEVYLIPTVVIRNYYNLYFLQQCEKEPCFSNVNKSRNRKAKREEKEKKVVFVFVIKIKLYIIDIHNFVSIKTYEHFFCE